MHRAGCCCLCMVSGSLMCTGAVQHLDISIDTRFRLWTFSALANERANEQAAGLKQASRKRQRCKQACLRRGRKQSNSRASASRATRNPKADATHSKQKQSNAGPGKPLQQGASKAQPSAGQTTSAGRGEATHSTQRGKPLHLIRTRRGL